jgi:hypothetical protein
VGDASPEIVASLNDGFVYAFSAKNELLWRYDVTHGQDHMFMSEPVIADLNDDGAPEVVFGTYSLDPDGGHLIILDNTGKLLHDVPLPNQGMNGNGIGVPAAPTIGEHSAEILSELGFPWRICRGVAIIGRAIGLVGHIAEEMRNPIAYEIYERAEKEVAENGLAKT